MPIADMEKNNAEKDEVISEKHSQSVLLYDEDGRPQNFPVPSSDPNDPLTFSIWRQRLILTVICIYAIAGFGIVQTAPLFFAGLIREYKQQTRGAFDAAQIADLASYPSLCMGLGNFLFVPLSMAIGRRYALLLCNAILLASVIWAAKSESFESHLGARCLQGLTAGVSDCLLPIIVLDISFLHLRSARLVMYWTLTAVGSSLLLVLLPFMVDSANGNWRVAYWFWTAIMALSLVLVIFFFPETLFHRRAEAFDGVIHATDAYGTFRIFATVDEAQAAGFEVAAEDGRSERPLPPPPKASYARQLVSVRLPPKPAFRFFSAYKDIFLSILIPGTFWALIFNSIVFGGLVVISLHYAERLEMEPWHFSSSTVGTVQLGSAVGALCALLFGATAEPISRYLTRRNGGVREPEHVLPNFLLPITFAFAGLLLYGIVGNQPGEYSWVGIHAAFALFYCGFCGISAFTGVWLGELLPHMSGPAIVLVCGGRNAVSFGYSNSFNRWLTAMGFRDTHILFGGILFALGFLALPLYYTNGHIQKAMKSLHWLWIN